MPLAYRVIPTILCRGRTQVKGERFDAWRSVGSVVQAVRVHAMRGVDEVVLLDIGATPEGRGPDLALVEELSEVLFAPLAVGGGVKSVDDVRALLRAGADKVVIGEGSPIATKLAAEVVGCQAIVVAIDVDARGMVAWGGHKPSELSPVAYAQAVESEGAGEIILTSIDREGTQRGYDLDLIRDVSKAVSIPVVAHGGCSGYEDMARAIEAGASAVAAGALFQFTQATPREAAKYLAEHGIEARV